MRDVYVTIAVDEGEPSELRLSVRERHVAVRVEQRPDAAVKAIADLLDAAYAAGLIAFPTLREKVEPSLWRR